jgi:opacity protein-like surface antigen
VKRRGMLFLLLLITLPATAFAQNLELAGGWSHLTGNNGLDGANVSAGWQFNRHVTLVAEADFLFDTSKAGVFDLSSTTGSVSVKSNSQNYLGGGRFRIIGWKPLKSLEKRKLLPFGEVLFGVSRLHQEVKDTQGTISVDASDRAFTWVLGGGVDYTLSAKWLVRGRLDFVRTHFVDEGQSRLRLNIGLAYSF